MSEFQVTVTERPEIRSAGVKVRTTMQKAGQDCPELWEKRFGPVMASFPADPAHANESYGVSVMVDDENFDYWATMPLRPDAQPPEDMDILTIPGGFYARCEVPSLAKLGDAFTYIYGEWAAGQDKYTLNLQGVGYELYTCEFMQTGKLTIFCALIEK